MKKRINGDIWAVGNTAIVFGTSKDPAHSVPMVKASSGDTEGICKWGDDNLYPQNLISKLKRTGTAVGGLDVLTSAHFGTGFQLIEEDDASGEIQFKERSLSSFLPIKDFFKRVKGNIFFADIVEDYETFRLAFPEYLLTPNFQEIKSVRRLPAAWGRFSTPNNQGYIENVIFNSDWEANDRTLDKKIRCFDASIPIEEIKAYCQQNKIYSFTIPVIDTLTIEKVYPSVGWHSSFKNGWVDVVLSIPEFKKFMFENQLNVKYLVHVSDEYFLHKYGVNTWTTFGEDVQRQKRSELIDAIDDKMSGNQNSGGSLISPFFLKEGKEVKGIQIETIGQAEAQGEFLLDASAGNSEILFPMGVDPSLLGGGIPGGKNLSGSGSDKREAWTILCARMPKRQIRTLQIFENIKEWNGWPENVYGKFPNMNLTTLDKNPNGQQKVIV